MYGESHNFKRKREGAHNRISLSLLDDDLQLLNRLESDINVIFRGEPMTRSKAFSIILKYANVHILQEDMVSEAQIGYAKEQKRKQDERLQNEQNYLKQARKAVSI